MGGPHVGCWLKFGLCRLLVNLKLFKGCKLDKERNAYFSPWDM